jgi:hypothetical protein
MAMILMMGVLMIWFLMIGTCALLNLYGGMSDAELRAKTRLDGGEYGFSVGAIGTAGMERGDGAR